MDRRVLSRIAYARRHASVHPRGLSGVELPFIPMRQHLRPLFDRVVIKELEPDRVRQSGLLVPAGSHEIPPQHGIVLAVGPGLDWWEHVGLRMPVSPGDHVVFPFSAGAWVEVEEERLLVVRVGELLGVLDGDEPPPAAPPA